MSDDASPRGETRSIEPVDNRRRRFESLVQAHSAELYRHAYWLCGQDALAQDLVQETFLRAWRSLDALRDAGAAKAWLATILRREHARLYERKPMPSTDIDDLELHDDAPGPEGRGEDATLRAAIARLDAKYREPLVLQVLGGFSCAEIAQQLGISESAVMTQVFRARQKLKELLDGDGKEATHGLR